MFRLSLGSQHVATVLCHALEDSRDLLRRLPFRKDDFRQSLAQPPVMVDLGESQVFKWKMSQPSNSLIGADGPVLYLLENFAER